MSETLSHVGSFAAFVSLFISDTSDEMGSLIHSWQKSKWMELLESNLAVCITSLQNIHALLLNQSFSVNLF